MKTSRIMQSVLLRGTIAASLLLLFQNCGGFASGLSYDSLKSGALANGSVFAAANEIIMIGDACYEVTPSGAQTEVPCPTPTPIATPTPPSSPTPNPEDPTPTATPETNPTATPSPTATPQVDPPTQIDVPNYCGTGYTQVAGYSLRTAGENLKVVILPDQPFEDFIYQRTPVNPYYSTADVTPLTNVQPVCEWTDPLLRADLLNRKLTIRDIKAHCPNLAAGTYTLGVVHAGKTTDLNRNLLNAEYNFMTGSGISIQSPYQVDYSRALSRVQIDIASGPKVASIHGTVADPRYVPMVILDTYGQPGCDVSLSPLIVQMKSNSPLRLTSQEDGKYFDIMGLMATPIAHTKKLISWLMPGAESENYFVVLPNRQGQVNGIEELFGNNTSGPDGKFAKNGYEALRKWDGRLANGKYSLKTRDGFIDEKDAVFSKLRFWKDKNFDAVAQPDELYTLKELGVTFIDLKADSKFIETDQYGNHTTLKSVVGTSDGALHVIYDLWFALKD